MIPKMNVKLYFLTLIGFEGDGESGVGEQLSVNFTIIKVGKNRFESKIGSKIPIIYLF
jgi:hypothetical protein